MNDPWKDIADEVEFHLRSSASSPEVCEDIVTAVRKLKADADALLTFKNEVMCITDRKLFNRRDEPYHYQLANVVREAHTALPEPLK